MYLLLIALVMIFLFIMYRPAHNVFAIIRRQQTEYNETVNERIDYMTEILLRRRYVPLEALPAIRFNTNLSTVNDGETKCLSIPIFVGIFETPNFDCATLCDNPQAAYFYVGEHDKFVVNGQLLDRGGYCTTSSVPRNCNRETSVIMHSLNQWTCIAEDPRYFAGPQNMTQVAGRQHANQIAPGQIARNIIFDKLMGMEVDVSRNTFRRSWDELLPGDNVERRFEMRCNALDNHNNRMFINPMNPIECLPNVCTNVNNVHPDVRPNFVSGECECGDFNTTRVTHIMPNDPTSICASVVDGFNRDILSHTFRVECTNLDQSLEHYSPMRLLCPASIFTQNTDNAYTFTLTGSFPMSGNGIDEPTHRLYLETRSRVDYDMVRAIPQ